MMKFNAYKIAVSALGLLAFSSVFASPFTPGNIVVTRFGDGNSPLTAVATPCYLDEYTPLGLLVQTIPMPTTASGGNRMFSSNGASTSEGGLNRSIDGHYLTLMGYDCPFGQDPVTASALTYNRVIAFVNASGVIDTSTALTDCYGGTASQAAGVRSAISTDGNDVWTAGTGQAASSGVRYTTKGSSTTTKISGLSPNPTNIRVVGIYNGQLYCATGSGAYKGVSMVGTGLPTGPANVATVTMLSGFDTNTGSTADPYGFYFADANTLYVGDNRTIALGGGIQKWTFDGSSWSLQYTLNVGLTDGIRHISGTTTAGITTIFAISGHANTGNGEGSIPTKLVRVTDAGASSPCIQLAISANDTAFRGVCQAPFNTVTLPADSITTTQGTRFSGNLASVANVDSDRYCAFDDDNSLTTEIQFTTHSPFAVPASITLDVVSNAARVGLQYNIGLFDFSANDFVDLTSDEETLVDSSKTVIVNSSVANYVQSPSMVVRGHVVWYPFNDETPSQDGWLTCINKISFSIQ